MSLEANNDKPLLDPRLVYARELIRIEADSVKKTADHLNSDFSRALDAILLCSGRVVVTGLGKPGFVAQKLSATMASTGTPSLYLHPTEAAHGDLGRVLPGDILMAISYSGETEEILRLLPPLRSIKVPVIAMTGNPKSSLARLSDIVLSTGPITETCPMGLAPTASSLALMALADALAMSVLKERPFSTEDYARLHPGGSLGRKLMKVGEIMRSGEACPIVPEDATLSQALVTMTKTPGRPGAAMVVNRENRLIGIFTDGDLRRLLESSSMDFSRCVSEVMGKNPRTIGPDHLAFDAAKILRDTQVDQLPVVDADEKPIGLLDVQDLLAAKFI